MLAVKGFGDINMDENTAMLYHFSMSVDDNVDGNTDTGRIRG